MKAKCEAGKEEGETFFFFQFEKKHERAVPK
jgi:hypothetical protein